MIRPKNIPKGIIKVDKPDHPFAFDGPDMLLSETNGLLAIFEIRKNENKNLNKLFARLTNALIAYPASTKMLLLYNHKMKSSDVLSQFWQQYFNDFIEKNDIRRAKSIIRDKKPSYRINEIKNIQKKLFSIQSQVQQNNLDYIKKVDFKKSGLINKSELKEKGRYKDKLTNKETKTRANIFVYKNHIIGVKSLSRGSSDIVELQPYYEFVINSEFDVDNGVPYHTHLSKKVLNLDDVPRIHYDPLKPLRIASLFGWLVSNSNSLHEIEIRIPPKRN